MRFSFFLLSALFLLSTCSLVDVSGISLTRSKFKQRMEIQTQTQIQTQAQTETQVQAQEQAQVSLTTFSSIMYATCCFTDPTSKTLKCDQSQLTSQKHGTSSDGYDMAARCPKYKIYYTTKYDDVVGSSVGPLSEFSTIYFGCVAANTTLTDTSSTKSLVYPTVTVQPNKMALKFDCGNNQIAVKRKVTRQVVIDVDGGLNEPATNLLSVTAVVREGYVPAPFQV